MVISYFGVGMVKVQLGDTVIVFNPIGESAEHKAVKFGSDVALVSLLDPAWNGVENAARGDRQPFIVNGPGEYEVNGIFIKGCLSPRGMLALGGLVGKVRRDGNRYKIFLRTQAGRPGCFLNL
jgi:hypothetical protein